MGAFMRHWTIVAVLAGNFAGCFIGLGFESLIPPTTDRLLGWGGHHSHRNGYVFTAIGVTLLIGQLTVLYLTKLPNVSDGAVFLLGLGGMSSGCALMAFSWASIPTGVYLHPFSSDQMIFIKFVFPCVVTALFMPLCMNTSVALFMRLANHSLGGRIGQAQAIQMNITSVAPLLCPLYQFFTYPKDVQETGVAPFMSLVLMSLFGFLIVATSIFAKPHWGFQ